MLTISHLVNTTAFIFLYNIYHNFLTNILK